ncbi:MAG: alpha/beta fold hydrolase [Acetobacteraceae bacterium]|nr:alpha/beta fold hydrolase [Acetobacteraceae bacterium]
MLLPLKDRNIAYDLIGPETAPVVCMTHSLASDGGMWAEQVPALLGGGFRVLRIDMRGHGGSGPVDGPYTMSQLAGDVVAVLDALAIAKVHFIGLSIGGMIGQAFALEHGDRLLSAMWCDTMPRTPPGSTQAWEDREKIVRDANSLEPLADPTVERWLTDGHKARNPNRYQQIRDTIAGTSPAGYLGCTAAIKDYDFIPGLPSVKLPVLVVCGADDAGTPPEGNRRIAELVADGRYEQIADARHFPNVEHPETFNRIMMGWLKAR